MAIRLQIIRTSPAEISTRPVWIFDDLPPYRTFRARANGGLSEAWRQVRFSTGRSAHFSLAPHGFFRAAPCGRAGPDFSRGHRPGPGVTGLIDADPAAARERDLREQPPPQALHRGARDAARLQVGAQRLDVVGHQEE